ncbi:MAG: TonB-dependent receptor [Bacteroidota bacterium]|nr:TonB-dependent receptor [Bacteroidota bacterium]
MRKLSKFGHLLVAIGLVTLMEFFSCPVYAINGKTKIVQQVQSVKGVVVDETDVPMVGVTVMVKGTTIGTVTNTSGEFSIKVPSTGVLEVSFIGYKKQSVNVGSKSVVNFKMEPDANVLDEVVAIGYGSVKKRDLTGSVESFKAADIKASPTTNVMEALQGKISGMDILKPSGAVGSNVDITMRGTRSIYGDNSPLFIIDGIPGSYNQVNPSDIESVDVLKDASATAIYGSAGSNGVIIITTKKGKEGAVTVNFDGYVGAGGAPKYKHGMIGDEFMTYQKEYYRTKNGIYPEDETKILGTNENVLKAYHDAKWIDWVKEAINGHASQQNYNLSINGGSQKTKVFSSFNVDRQDGMLLNENQSRYGIRFNADHEIRKWIKIGTTSNMTYTIKNARGTNVFTKCLTAFPLGDVYDQNGNLNSTYIDGNTTPMGDELPGQYKNQTRSSYINSNTYMEIMPLKGLTYRSILGFTLSNSRQGQYIGRGSIQSPESQYSAPFTKIVNSYGYGYTFDNILTYNFKVANDHDFTATAISSWGESQSDGNDMRAQGQGLDSYEFYNIQSAGTTLDGVNSSYSQTQKLSFAGRLAYSYKGKYLLSFTNRWDGVSWLAEGHKWANFPAGAVAWRISDESFMNETKNWLTNLKARVSYGVTGNSGGMGAYSSQTGATTYSAVSVDGTISQNTQMVSPYANPSIGWEKSYNLNLGLDLGLFNNRIDFVFELYKTDTKDLLFQRTVPITSAITAWGSPINTWQNIGETSNKGVNITLRTRNIRTGDFEWTTAFNFTRNIERIVDLPLGNIVASKLFEGHPVKTHYDYKYKGIWSTADATEATLYGCAPGYVKVATNEVFTTDATTGQLVGDGGVHKYTTNDKQILGSNVPDGIIGLTNTFNWKGLDLSIHAMARYGQVIYSNLLGYYDAAIDNQPSGTDYWLPGTNEGAYYPRPGIASTVGIESLRYIDGSFIKIKTITLGYTFPKNFLRKIGVANARVYATAYNPFIFVFDNKLKGTDPENNGSDSFPSYSSSVVGVSFTF